MNLRVPEEFDRRLEQLAAKDVQVRTAASGFVMRHDAELLTRLEDE